MSEVVDVVVILDRSGSMMGMEVETIGAFNAFLREQKKLDGEAVLSVVLFDNKIETLHDRVDIQKVEDLTKGTYFTRGSTSLFDAVGQTIKHIESQNKNNKVVFLIQSDGYENTSQEYTGNQVQEMIKAKEEDGWDFNYIGTGLDDFAGKEIGGSFGLRGGKSLAVPKSAQGMGDYSLMMSSVATSYRAGDKVENLDEALEQTKSA